MAASDNVVRAGLTPKFKDVEVLTKMLTYQAKSSADQLLTGALYATHSLLYDPPIDEFSVILTALAANDKESLPGSEGPSVVIVTEGKGVIRSREGQEITVEVGNVYFIGANVPFSIEALDEGVIIYTAFSVKPGK